MSNNDAEAMYAYVSDGIIIAAWRRLFERNPLLVRQTFVRHGAFEAIVLLTVPCARVTADTVTISVCEVKLFSQRVATCQHQKQQSAHLHSIEQEKLLKA